MDPQAVSESVARQLAQVWAIHRTPAFVEQLLQTYGCEPLKPVRFAGIFSLQMIGGFFFPDLPAGPGPVVERLWLMDDSGFRPANMDELRSVENLASDNPLVVYDSSRASYDLIGPHPRLHAYPRFRFCVRDSSLVYHEEFGFKAGCRKAAKLVISNEVYIQDVCVQWTIWQSRLRDVMPT